MADTRSKRNAILAEHTQGMHLSHNEADRVVHEELGEVLAEVLKESDVCPFSRLLLLFLFFQTLTALRAHAGS
jgi:hypothetical protein